MPIEIRNKSTPQSFDHHPDYQNNLSETDGWLKTTKFPDGLRVELFSSHYFKHDLLTFMATVKRNNMDLKYANSISLHQQNKNFHTQKESLSKVYYKALGVEYKPTGMYLKSNTVKPGNYWQDLGA